MLPKTGRSSPPGPRKDGHVRRYADIISLALKAEFDGAHRTIKTVQRWTNASERTVKNWICGSCGPRGDHLITLLIHSDTTLQMLLIASRRFDLAQILMERSQKGDNLRQHAFVAYDPDRVPVNDPEYGPDEGFVPNERQRWFLAELASGERVSARSMRDKFGVAEKTAKRDIVNLKTNGMISFVGTRRSGRYRLRQRNLFSR